MTQYNQIKAQIAKLEREAESLRKKEIKHIVQQIRRLMAEHNLSLDDLREPRSRKGGKAAAGKAKRKPAAKKRRSRASKVTYRSPDDKSLTWSGMGRQPKWITELIESGQSLDDLRVNP